MAVKQILSNCKILYGNDSVTIGLRREEIIRDYFHGEIPEVTVLDSPGNYDPVSYTHLTLPTNSLV